MKENQSDSLLEGEEQQIRNLIDSDGTWKKMHFAILEESNKIVGKPVLERVMIGRRLLSTSREALKRIFFLSYSYRMTGYQKFLKRADEEILAVSRFSDWNPSHFLDAPANNYDAANPGTIIVGFECEILSNTKETFEVILVPSTASSEGEFLNKTLGEW